MKIRLITLIKNHNTNISVTDIYSWDIIKAFSTLSKLDVYEPLYIDEFWENVQPEKENIRTFNQIITDGHKVAIVIASVYKTIYRKFEMLFKFCKCLNWDDVIVTSQKQMIKGNALIDDGIHNLEGEDYMVYCQLRGEKMDVRSIVSTTLIISMLLAVLTMILVTIININKKIRESIKKDKAETSLKPLLEEMVISIEKGVEIDKTKMKKLGTLLANEVYLEYFNEYIGRVYDKIENKIELAKLIRDIPELITRVTSNLKSRRLDKRFTSIYITGLYKYDNEFTTNIIISNLENKSPYIRTNALNSLSLMGNPENLVSALLLINQSDRNDFTIKCITNVLDNFKGDFVALDEELLAIMGRLEEKLRIAIINHFTAVGYIPAAEMLYTRIKLINGVKIDNSEEVEIATIKYFKEVKYEDSRNYLVNNLKSDNWVVVAMSLKALTWYIDSLEENHNTILNLLKHKNIYVRQYASELLVNSIGNIEEIKKIISRNKEDKDIVKYLSYSLFERGDINSDEYTGLIEINQKKKDGGTKNGDCV